MEGNAQLRSLYLAEPNERGGISAPFEVLRAGEFNKDGDEIEITEADLDQMVANFNALKGRGHDELPVDFEHSFAGGGDSKAAGWIKELVRQGKSLFARVKWTKAASEQIREEEYRYISAEFDKNWTDEFGTEHGFALLAAGLTNRPFLRGMTPVALSDRIDSGEVRFLVPAISDGRCETPPEVAERKDNDKPKDGPELSEEQVVTAVKDGKLTFSAEGSTEALVEAFDREMIFKALDIEDPAKAAEETKEAERENVKLTERVGSLERTLLTEQRDRDLDQARREGRIDAADATTEKWHERYEKFGREEARSLLNDLPADVIPVNERGSGHAPEQAEFAQAPEGVDAYRFAVDKRAKQLQAEDSDLDYMDAVAKADEELRSRVA